MSYKKIIRSSYRRSGGGRAELYHERRKEAFFAGRTWNWRGPKRLRRKGRYMKGKPWESRTKENRTTFNRRDRRTHKRIHDWDDYLRDDKRIT